MSGREIPLTRGLVAIVDEEDYDRLAQWKWCAVKSAPEHFYAMRAQWDGKRNHYILMHRLIMAAEPGVNVDHRDRDTLNNRRSNLRLCSQRENSINRSGYRRPTTSEFKGVHWSKPHSKWCARFRRQYLGLFDEEIEAARAYDRAALAGAGEFALPNFPIGDTECRV